MTRRYPAYRDSGVEWLGEVPLGWGVAPLKAIFGIVGGTTPKSDVADYWDGEINWVTPADLSSLPSKFISDTGRKITESGLTSCGTSLVPAGSLILSTRAPIGSLAIAETEVCTNQGCKALVAMNRANPLFYFFILLAAKEALNVLGRGSTFLELSGDQLGSFRAPLPPLPEQTAIAAFLDRETAKIDGLVAEQRRLIDLLREKRQAVISQAVIRGLNPAAPLKPSGIDWLGDVPEGWEVGHLRYLCDLLRDGTHLPPSRVSEGVPLLSVRNVQNGQFSLRDDDSMISESDFEILSRTFVPQTNDVLLAIVGATLGKSALVPENMPPFHIQRSLAIFRPRAGVSSEWLNFMFQCQAFQQLLWSSVGFSAQPGVYLGMLSEVRFPFVPVDEQMKIVAYLTAKVSAFDALTATAFSAIALLQERRAALISAAVTGKIDVRRREVLQQEPV